MTRELPLPPVGRYVDVAEDETETDEGLDSIILRPDGYYWQAPGGRQEIGPFETKELALTDMYAADEEAPEPGESLREAEDEIGIAEWIDPDTGELAEGQSRPRIEG